MLTSSSPDKSWQKMQSTVSFIKIQYSYRGQSNVASFLRESGWQLILYLAPPVPVLSDGPDELRRNLACLRTKTDDDTCAGDNLFPCGVCFNDFICSGRRRAQQFDACARGGNRLAMLVRLVDEMQSVCFVLEDRDALLPAGNIHGVEQDRGGGEKAEVNSKTRANDVRAFLNRVGLRVSTACGSGRRLFESRSVASALQHLCKASP
jgi:hypothetical protein